MSNPIRVTQEATAQMIEADRWWRENRPAARNLFLDELNDAFKMIGNSPHAGRLYQRSPLRGVRRVLLKATRFHVYYLPVAEENLVLAVWSARRGSGPSMAGR